MRFCLKTLSLFCIKPNANLFRTKSLLLRSGSINLLRNCLQNRHVKIFTFCAHNFQNVISKHTASERGKKWKRAVHSYFFQHTAPMNAEQFTVFSYYWSCLCCGCCCCSIYHFGMIIECMKINCFASFEWLGEREHVTKVVQRDKSSNLLCCGHRMLVWTLNESIANWRAGDYQLCRGNFSINEIFELLEIQAIRLAERMCCSHSDSNQQ